jgi:glycosyl transferase, family 25
MIHKSTPLDQEALAANAAPSLEIVVINLKRAEERRRLISAQFAELSHPWRFFEAHTSLANPKLRYDPERILRTYGGEMTPPQLALCSSHYSVIATFAESGTSDYLLVFEDDVIFDTAFPLDEITTLCRAQGINYMRLFGMYYSAAKQLSFFFDRAIVRYRSSPAGAQAYILSKVGAARVAETCQEIDTAWDLMLDSFWRTGLPIHAVYPFPTIERWSPTSVPMYGEGKLALRDRLAWFAHRARNKLRKAFANLQLRQSDKALHRSDQGFRQINPETFRDG